MEDHDLNQDSLADFLQPADTENSLPTETRFTGKRVAEPDTTDGELDLEDIFVSTPKRQALTGFGDDSIDLSPDIPDESNPDNSSTESLTESEPSKRAKSLSKSPKRLVAIVVALVLVLTAVGVFVWYIGWEKSSADLPPATTSTEQSRLALGKDSPITITEVAKLVERSPWRESFNGPGDQAEEKPICLTESLTDSANQTFWVGALTNDKSKIVVVNQLGLFSDTETAQQNYRHLVDNIASCPQSPVLIESAATVANLGKQAMVFKLTVQNESPIYHMIVLINSEKLNWVFDFSSPSSLDLSKLLSTTAQAVTRTCQIGGGECSPGDATGPQLKTSPIIVPPSSNPGWLGSQDLPRLTPGAGIWSVSTSQAVPASYTGTGCEKISLATADGPIDRTRRSYLLIRDDKLSDGFSIDEFVFLFEDQHKANAFANELKSNISSCAKESPQTKIANQIKVSGQGEKSSKFSGKIFHLARTSGQSSDNYWSSVVQLDKKVLYLVNSSGPTAGFEAEIWQKITLRAGERLSQHR